MNWSRKVWIIGMFLLLIMPAVEATQKPNFILLLTDDQSYCLGMLDVLGLATPNIDALASRGAFFFQDLCVFGLLCALPRVDPDWHVSALQRALAEHR